MTATQVKDVGSKLIHLLNQQRLLYCQLKELAQKQSSLVDGHDPEMLLRILAGRQRLIDRLAMIDRELAPIRSDWQRIAESLPVGQRKEAQELVAGVQAILGEILASDQQDAQAMSQQQQRVADELQTTVRGKRVNQAYAQAGAGGQSRYLDTQSE